MTQVKSFGILVEAKGEGRARHAYRRNRRHRTSPSPLIHTDDTDQESGGSSNPPPRAAVPHGSGCAQTHANLGWFGMTSVKPFGMLVEAKREGVGRGDCQNCQNR
jgi:hypothetical protein